MSQAEMAAGRDKQMMRHQAGPGMHEPLRRLADDGQTIGSAVLVPGSQGISAAANHGGQSSLPSNLNVDGCPSSLTALLDQECGPLSQDPGSSSAGLKEKTPWQLAAERELLLKGLRGLVEALLRGRQQQHDASVLKARHGFLRLAGSLQVLVEQCDP